MANGVVRRKGGKTRVGVYAMRRKERRGCHTRTTAMKIGEGATVSKNKMSTAEMSSETRVLQRREKARRSFFLLISE